MGTTNKTIHCVIKNCTWNYNPEENPLSYSEISTQGHKELNDFAMAQDLAEYLNKSMGIMLVETARKTNSKLQEHLENHSVTDWLETLAHCKEQANKNTA